MDTKLLIIDDDHNICDMLRLYFENEGYEVKVASDGVEGLTYFKMYEPDLVLLDIMLPKKDGWQVCREIREISSKPIIMVTAKGEVFDKVLGLELGADDYLTKPFDSRELLACINALLRRQGTQVDELTYGNTSLDLASGMLVCGEKSIRLTAREFDVMRFLLQAQGRILSKEVLLSRIWGYESNAVENHVEVYVGFLRKKLARIESNIRIEAIRRLGYHLEVDKT